MKGVREERKNERLKQKRKEGREAERILGGNENVYKGKEERILERKGREGKVGGKEGRTLGGNETL